MSKSIRLFLLIFAAPLILQAGYFLPDIFQTKNAGVVIGKYAEQEQQLKTFTEQLAKIEPIILSSADEAKKQLAIIQDQGQSIARKREHAVGTEINFLRKKETLLNELSAAISDTQRLYEQYKQVLKQAIDEFKRYLANPTSDDVRAADKSSYTFNEFQQAATQLLSAQQEFERAAKDKKRIAQEIKKNDDFKGQLAQVIKQKESERQALESQKASLLPNDFTQKSELIDLELQVTRKKLENISIVQQELYARQASTQIKIIGASAKVDICKRDVAQIERRLWVHTLDIQAAQNIFDEKKYEIDEKLIELNARIKELTVQRDAAHAQFDKLNNSLTRPIKDVQQIQEWRLDGNISAVNMADVYAVALAYEEYDTLSRELMLVQANADTFKYQLIAAELNVEILKTWLALVQRTLLRDEEVRQERIAYFTSKQTELEQAAANYASHSAEIEQLMGFETRALTHIKSYQSRTTVFDSRQISLLVGRAHKEVDKQLDLNGQLIKTYTAISANIVDMRHQVDMMLSKIESVDGIWQRTATAVTWEGIKGTGRDLKFFAEEVFALLSRATVIDIATWVKLLINDPLALLNLLFAFIALAIVYVLFLFGLPLFSRLLRAGSQTSVLHVITGFFATIVDFCSEHLVSLLCWSALFYTVRFDALVGIGSRTKLAFFLVSIVYLCLLVRAFIEYYIERSGDLVQDSFYRRFLWVLRFFIFATIIIYFLREAFLSVSYGHSEVPTLLLAIYSIITRISIIMLIMTKDVILDALPKHGSFWGFAREYLNQYYKLIFVIIVALIVMSDPFVGYGRLVATVVQSSLLTVFLVIGLWLLQTVFKHYSSLLFFDTRDESVKERFAHAKTWYAFFIVLSFAVVIVLASVALAKIWGHQASFDSVIKFFNIEIGRVPGEVPGQTLPIMLSSLGILIAFIFVGFFVSSLFVRYVLVRIYQLLQINIGVQNTVSRISSYLIIILILIIGLQQVGLGGWIPVALGLFAFGLAWAIREPASDFIAYFIILVERTIKVGDFIRLENSKSDQSGFVRKISPRTVVLRKNNSYSIIVPNSRVIHSTLYNWHYTGSFFAFDDIKLAVTYKADPVKVKEVILTILSKRTDILKNPAPIVRLTKFGETGLEFMIRAFLSMQHVGEQWDIRSDIRFAIVHEFAEHGIEFAVQVYDVMLSDQRTDKKE